MKRTDPVVSGFAERIPSSGIREIFNLAVARNDVLHLEVGEPDFPTPAHIVEAAFEAAKRGSGYTQTGGVLELREAAAARLSRVHGLDYDPDQILFTQGAVQGIATVIGALVTPGDEVLMPDPGWPNYEMLTLAQGGMPVRYPLRSSNQFQPDPGQIKSLISERCRLLVLNSPGNPTGTVVDDDYLKAIVGYAAEAGIPVLSDEVYDEIVFDGRLPQNAAVHDLESVIGVWSCSKTYAMTGWRVGYMAMSSALAPHVTKLQEAMISCISSITQAGALAALTGPQDCVAAMRDAYSGRRDQSVKQLADAGLAVVEPGGAFYLMVPLAEGADARLAALDLVEHGVAVAPGTAFGREASSHLRISLASSESTLQRALGRLLDWFERNDGGAGFSPGRGRAFRNQ